MRRTLAALILAALAVGGMVHPSEAAGLPPGLPGFGGPFQLVDQTGAPRSDADFRGRFMLVTFGYTACPDLCPLELGKIAAALDALPPAVAARVAPLFITVDPAHDTPEHLAEYVAAFHPAIIGLTGSKEAVGAAIRAYRVHVAVTADGTIDHTGFLYLMGPDGGFLTLIMADASADAIAARLRHYAGSGTD